MVSWQDVVADAPDFAARVRERFDAGKHKTMATLRADGSPRISGIEIEFEHGQVVLGSMPDSVKGRDLRRDPRLAVHSPSLDPPEDASTWSGDAKMSGRAVFGPSPPPPATEGDYFTLDVEEIVLTRVGTPADHLVIESWHPGRGLRRRTRA
ncbi:MAG: pyridoxamine 5'-phosphate oxidase family protein [Actinobacteria bacterium]|nr:pyridoxamine 5'-phosphate oxidase family protein [Actinomycetota bacterium]